MNHLWDNMAIKKVKQGDIALKKGTRRDYLLILVIEGSIIKEGTEEVLVKKGEIFGERSILMDDTEIFENNYVYKGKGIIAFITKEKFEKVIRGKLRQILKLNERSHEVNLP